MLRSVFENGGFYIGRYETGTQTPRFSASDNLTTPVIQKDVYPYNFVTCRQAQEHAIELATGGKTSSLMFGIQWDLVLKFIEEKGAKTQAELKTNSGSWGNYSNVTFKLTNGLYITTPNKPGTWHSAEGYTKSSSTPVLLTIGASDRNSALNIYDLAGNVWEWTLEYTSSTNSPCSIRGGNYSRYASDYPAANRSNIDTSYSYGYGGFRIALW